MKKFILISIVLFFGCRQLIEYFSPGTIKTQDVIHLQFIGLSMRFHGNVTGRLPIDGNETGKLPSNIADKDGKPLLSWRVDLLRYGVPEVRDLYQQFKLDEPWNSPHNLKVAQKVPFEYVDPKGPSCTPNNPAKHLYIMNPQAPNYTPYLAVTGPNAAFRPGKPRDYDPKDFRHAAVIMVDKSDVLWTEPRDISVDQIKKGNVLRFYGEGFYYLSSNGSMSNSEYKPKFEYDN